MAVIDLEDCDIDFTQVVSFYIPTAVMANTLKLKKKSRQGPDMLRALRTVHADMIDSRGVLSWDDKIPS